MPFYIGCCCGSGSGSGVSCGCSDPGATIDITFAGLDDTCTYDYSGCPYSALQNTTYTLNRCLSSGCINTYRLGGLSPCDIFELYDSGDDTCTLCPDDPNNDVCNDSAAPEVSSTLQPMFAFVGTKTDCDGAGTNFDFYLGIVVHVSGTIANTDLRVTITIRTIAVQTNLSPVVIFMNYTSSYGFGAYYINGDCAALGGASPCWIGDPSFGDFHGWYGDTTDCLPETFTQLTEETCCRGDATVPITCTVSL